MPELASKDIQQRFRLTDDSPCRDESTFFYNFQLDDTRLGFAEVTCNHTTKKAIFWKFYPLDQHCADDSRRNWYQPSGVLTPGLEGKGIASLAHILMTRNVMAQLFADGQKSEEYRAVYVSVGDRMRTMLERLGIFDSLKSRGGMPLDRFLLEQEKNAKRIFGYDVHG